MYGCMKGFAMVKRFFSKKESFALVKQFCREKEICFALMKKVLPQGRKFCRGEKVLLKELKILLRTIKFCRQNLKFCCEKENFAVTLVGHHTEMNSARNLR